MLKEKSRNIQFEAFHVFKVSFSLMNLFMMSWSLSFRFFFKGQLVVQSVFSS